MNAEILGDTKNFRQRDSSGFADTHPRDKRLTRNSLRTTARNRER